MTNVLLYNISKDKLPKIQFILFKLGLRARRVSPEEYAQPIGYLAGLEGFEPAEAAPGEPFTGEMLVMAGLSSQQFSAFRTRPCRRPDPPRRRKKAYTANDRPKPFSSLKRYT